MRSDPAGFGNPRGLSVVWDYVKLVMPLAWLPLCSSHAARFDSFSISTTPTGENPRINQRMHDAIRPRGFWKPTGSQRSLGVFETSYAGGLVSALLQPCGSF